MTIRKAQNNTVNTYINTKAFHTQPSTIWLHTDTCTLTLTSSQAHARARTQHSRTPDLLIYTHAYQYVQYFPVSQQWYSCQCMGSFNVHIDACDCAWGLYEHCKRVCTESWRWEKNPLPHTPGNQTLIDVAASIWAGRSTSCCVVLLLQAESLVIILRELVITSEKLVIIFGESTLQYIPLRYCVCVA